MPLFRHAEKCGNLQRLLALRHQFGEGTSLVTLDFCCWDCPFDRFHLVQNAEHWWRKFDSKGRHRRSSPIARFFYG